MLKKPKIKPEVSSYKTVLQWQPHFPPICTENWFNVTATGFFAIRINHGVACEAINHYVNSYLLSPSRSFVVQVNQMEED